MRRRGRGDCGNVSLLVVIMVPALLAAGGLVLDGGRQLEARRESQGAAASAARAAAQMSEQEVYARALDPTLAGARADAHLAAAGHVGQVVVTPDRVTVTVTETVQNLILPGAKTVSSTSTSAAIDGISTAVAP